MFFVTPHLLFSKLPIFRISRLSCSVFLVLPRSAGPCAVFFSVIVVSINLLNKEEVLEKYPHQLSGGMLQRIMIGIAMTLQPELLIADEPTTAIDAITQYEILEEFIRIKKNKNTAMLFITHDLGAISKVADRILVMNSGRIVDSGSFEHEKTI